MPHPDGHFPAFLDGHPAAALAAAALPEGYLHLSGHRAQDEDRAPENHKTGNRTEGQNENHPAGGAAIRVRGVSKDFGGLTVLDRLDLDVAPGEFLAIVGKSGCGKSTLLRLLTGLDTATSGSLAIDGKAPQKGSDDIRLMFQEPRLLPWEKVAGNVAIGLRHGSDTGNAGLSAATHTAALPQPVAEALEAVQLSDKAHVWPSTLSGGQKQRAALARALVSHPRLLAFDEPLGALDALTRLVMQELILKVKQQTGFTAILVTHDVAEAVALADRVIVLDEGRIKAEFPVPLPHPRPRASTEAARIEAQILAAIFG
ncbi:Aliphatic sulfonates import ATP-binding protein SsuB [Pannonibacter phragmitetus]|uniref:Aliphatic sulfonates import ATP-binding protein SsuB n=1 Tax=Pannonibacter phragmitetus TaxID=121719 RepID=A0A378ZXN0_9HYPH|nr:ABC transporter ATP-binding protein [Pannonibacter phragmitetus]SUB01599.1 Aliphatic sulfonates import ATP-binding protein SsuB [Pannonibacter phragmitetus]